jgi:hypothetical protein
MTLIKAQLSLIKLWLVALAPIVVLTLGRTFGYSGSQMTGIWKTVSPAIVPSLVTVLGTFSFANFGEQADKQVNLTFFRITYWVSAFYLATFVIMYAVYPSIQQRTGQAPTEILASFTTFLQTLDVTIVSACLGVFFSSSKKAEQPAGNDGVAPHSDGRGN